MSVNQPKLIIDLYSGTGGFSEAFKQNGWEVVRIDLDKKHKPTIQADVRYLPLKLGLKPDVLVASPSCTQFSIANPKFPRKGIKLAMEVVGACFEAVVDLEPKKWLVENPRGRLRHLAPMKPRMTINYSDFDDNFPTRKPTDLWGNFGLPMPKHVRRPKCKYKDGLSHYFPFDPVKRAAIPLGVSKAVYEGACIA